MRCPQCRHENPGDAKFCLEFRGYQSGPIDTVKSTIPGAGLGYDRAVGAIGADRSAPTATGFRFYRAAILCQVEFETSDVWTLGVPSATFATAVSTSG